jgi:hypothetical protein
MFFVVLPSFFIELGMHILLSLTYDSMILSLFNVCPEVCQKNLG